MTRHIVLLRGVNVGGHRRLPMAELRSVLSGLGYTDVATHIQSGNAVLTSEESDPGAVGALVREAVRGRFGFDVPVMVRTLDQLRAVVAANPLPVADPPGFMVLFCSEPVDTAALAAIDPATHPREHIAATPTEVFTHHERGVREAKLPAVVGRHCPGEITARNWRTVLRLLEMAEGD